MDSNQIDPGIAPSGAGCDECEELHGWWIHLRRCAVCGHIGCCDMSLGRHATAHFRSTGHRYMRSFEPGETWFWDYVAEDYVDGPELAPPASRPDGQPVPGPAGRVPEGWRAILAERDKAEASA